MSKNPRRKATGVASIMLSAALFVGIAGAATPAERATIDITGTGGGYSAYRLLNLTTSLNPNCKHAQAAMGADVNGFQAAAGHDPDCYNFSYSVNEKYRGALQAEAAAHGGDTDGDHAVSDAEIIAYIEKQSDADATRAFADSMYGRVSTLGSDYTAADKTFSDVAQGYYLIAETTTAGDGDSISLVMLDTKGEEKITVQSKEGVPTLGKKVYNENENDAGIAIGWSDWADVDGGDEVRFQLTGSMPENIDGYATYKYVFHDSLKGGLAFKANSVKVTIGGADVAAANYTVRTTGTHDGACDLEVEFADIKGLGIDIKADTKVIVEYVATLEEGSGEYQFKNDNTAYLEFSNDPYQDGTGKTPEDEVTVYSYDLVVNKVDKENHPVAGAQFQLMKWDETEGKYVNYGAVATATEENGNVFKFDGLDAGRYMLVEAVVPNGYTKAADLEFAINSTATEGALQLTTSNDAVTVSSTTGVATTDVINVTGHLLPSTGGPGLIALYCVGGAAVVSGLGLFLTKRRKDNADK